jgi:pimeloyl-ACP methyl ester carboxylesterase
MSDPTPILLIPGLLCDAALWRPQQDHLSARRSVRIADVTRADSVTELAQQALAEAPQHFILAGLSMGGYISLEIMRVAAERVSGLMLLDTSARQDTPEQAERRRSLIGLAKRGKFKGVTPRLLPLLIHPDRMKDGALTQTVLDMAERVGAEAFLRQQTAILGRIDSRPFLSQIRVPTAILCGDSDSLTPPSLSREMATDIPDARLTLIPNCGHLSTIEQPEAVNAAFDLLIDRVEQA